jgi:hypothetical protein
MATIPKTKVYNPQKAEAYVGKGVLKGGGKVKISAGGEKHVIYKKTSPTGIGKGKKGDIMVNHPTTDKGKWDTIDLTQKAKAKTVAQGVASTRKWHRENPEMKNGGKISCWTGYIKKGTKKGKGGKTVNNCVKKK